MKLEYQYDFITQQQNFVTFFCILTLLFCTQLTRPRLD